MEGELSYLLKEYESGRVTRRQLVACLAAFIASVSGGRHSTAADSSFEAIGLNHIALRVTDLGKSREFYKKLLGLKVAREDGSSCFLAGPNHFVALFKGTQAAMDHYCYAIKDYNQQAAVRKLKAIGIEPETPPGTDRIYFNDPDGLKVQLAASDHKP